MYVALDQGYLEPLQFRSQYDLSVKVKSLISGFIRYLRSGIKRSNVAR